MCVHVAVVHRQTQEGHVRELKRNITQSEIRRVEATMSLAAVNEISMYGPIAVQELSGI